MVNIVGGPNGPYGASNCPASAAGFGAGRFSPMRELPLSPWVISTVLHSPALIAAAAWRTWIMNEQPPTPVPSTYFGTMPR